MLFIALSLLELESAATLNPFARRILNDLSQGNVGFADLGDLSVVLAQVVTQLHLVQKAVDLQQGIRPPLLHDATNH